MRVWFCASKPWGLTPKHAVYPLIAQNYYYYCVRVVIEYSESSTADMS